MGWLSFNFPIVLIGKYHIPLSVSNTVAYPSQMVPSRTPTSRTYSWLATNKKGRRNQQACYLFLHLQLPHWCPTRLLQTRTHTNWLWTNPHRAHAQRSPKVRSPTACTHITTRSQTNHTEMDSDAQPAYPNRDSLRHVFKGFVALEIIFDLPFGFSNKKTLSLRFVYFLCLVLSTPARMLGLFLCLQCRGSQVETITRRINFRRTTLNNWYYLNDWSGPCSGNPHELQCCFVLLVYQITVEQILEKICKVGRHSQTSLRYWI